MSSSSSGRKTPVDCGVQIRFINDLHDGRGGQQGQPPRPKSQSPSKYGVAVRVQGIAGQPYVVLKDGQKGDSYGVQLKTNYPSGYGSLPRRKDNSQNARRGCRRPGWNTAQGSRCFPSSPYTSPPSSTHNSLGRSQQQTANKTPANQWTGRLAAAETQRTNLTETQVTPDLLLDQGQSAEASREEQQMMQTIYSILREGTNESDIVIKHKAKVILQNVKLKDKTQDELNRERAELQRKVAELQLALQQQKRDSINNSSATLKAELESCLDENLQLRELHDRMKKELNETQSELTQLRMDRENAEAHSRNMEDQLAELQDEIKKDNNNKTDLITCQNEMTEIYQAKQKLEETLRQRERELTALKGALKEEVASHDKELETLREQYSADMEKLRSSMEQVSQSHAGIEAERLRVNASVRTLQQQLEDCRDESSHWMEQFHNTRDELRTAKQDPKPIAFMFSQDLQKSNAELQKARLELEKQRTQFDKKSHQNQEAELKYEIDRLKDQLQRAKGEFSKAQEKNKKDQLKRSELDVKVAEDAQKAQEEVNVRLKEKVSRLEGQLLNNATESSEAELALHSEVRGLRSELDEAKRKASRLNQEHIFGGVLKRRVTGAQVQLEEQREKARKDLQEVHRHGTDAQTELERSHGNVRRMEEEDKLKREELELEEERSSVEMLTERLSRSRDQIDQLRSELMQERSSKQDLELDKNAMERHREKHGAGNSTSSGAETEDLNMTLDEERHNHSEQRDQLTLKVKALKRQVDEGETELERIDNLRRKAQRDAEEQMELKEALQSRVTTLETELNLQPLTTTLFVCLARL
ncbi:hypothetical protein WMY93_025644 [Mugilogobius chulae]|uniref:Cingulin n=1 Tax=Mugilogobius chulae TaxID=88201 RepID=A0AAW0N678_9GOBI